ncbi:MAG: helix-hairpin-helix domain-containing protein, partial [Pseudomonadota bacterium]
MQTFILETLLLLFLAFIVGAAIGSLLRWPFVRRDRQRLDEARARVREGTAARATVRADEATSREAPSGAAMGAAGVAAAGAVAAASVASQQSADERPDGAATATQNAGAQDTAERRATPEQLTSTRPQSVADISRAAHGASPAGAAAAPAAKPASETVSDTARRPVAAGSDGGSGAVAEVVHTQAPAAREPAAAQTTATETQSSAAASSGAMATAAATAAGAALAAAATQAGSDDQEAAAPAPVVAAVAPDEPLENIRGVTSQDAAALNAHGINRFEQIAALTQTDVASLEQAVGAGRISRENWIEQATILAKGGATAFVGGATAGVLSFAQRPQEPDGQTNEPTGAPTTDAAGETTASKDGVEQVNEAQQSALADEPVPAEAPIDTQDTSAQAEPTGDEPTSGASGSDIAQAAAVAAAGAGATGLGAVIAQRADDDQLVDATSSDSVAAFQAGLADGPDENLTAIAGVTASDVEVLNGFGVRRYEHVAALDTDMVGRIDRRVDGGPRVSRENWIEQAAILAQGAPSVAVAQAAGTEAAGTGAAATEGSSTGAFASGALAAGAAAAAGAAVAATANETQPDVAQLDETSAPNPVVSESSEDSAATPNAEPSFQGTLAAAAAAAATGAQFNPQALVGEPTPATETVLEGDDLTAIAGVDADVEARLKARGIRRWRDIASWTPSTVDVMETQLGLEGQIASGDWVAQAKRLNGEPIADDLASAAGVATAAP